MAQDTDWGAILNSILGMAPGIVSGINAGQAVGQGREAAAMADPFASQRGQYQGMLSQTLGQPGGAPNPYANMLQGLLTDPNSFKTDPGYQFALGQGQQAVSRGSNALYGTGRTGSLGPELAKYTEGYANQAYDKRIDQLAGLSGQQQNYNANLMKELLTASGADQGNPFGAAGLLMGGYSDRNTGYGQMLQGLSGFGGGGGVGQLLNTLLRGGSGSGIDYGNYATGPGAPQLGGPGGDDGIGYDINNLGNIGLGGGSPDWSLSNWSLE